MRDYIKMSNRATNLPIPFSFQFLVTTAGTAEQLKVKRRAATISFTAKSGQVEASISDSANLFIVAGFEAGDTITVSGATNGDNNANWEVITVAAGTLTLEKRHTAIVTEAAGATVTIVASKKVPEGVAVVVKAMYANTGNICVANSSARALNTGTGHFKLRSNESVSLQVSDVDKVWLDASVSGEGVEVIFEKEDWRK